MQHRSIGFVADERRINVGITRARCALLVIGHAASLAVDARWRNLVASAAERDVVFEPTKPYSDFMAQVVAGKQGTATISGRLRAVLAGGKPGKGGTRVTDADAAAVGGDEVIDEDDLAEEIAAAEAAAAAKAAATAAPSKAAAAAAPAAAGDAAAAQQQRARPEPPSAAAGVTDRSPAKKRRK